MARSTLYHIRRKSPPGATPGMMIAPAMACQPVINVIAYGGDTLVEQQGVAVEAIPALRSQHAVTWVDVVGLGSVDVIAAIGAQFGLHRLALEDVLNTHQRPKAEEFDDHIFFVTRMFRPEAATRTEQVAIFLGDGFVVSFQEQAGDCLEPVRGRIRQGRGRIRNKAADYLCYALLDAVVDDYFPVLERYGEELEVLEDDVISHSRTEQIGQLHELKRELLSVRRAVWPHREMVNAVIRDENPLIAEETRPYLRDVYDHTVQLMDIVETYREIASGLVDVYMSSVSARLNEIMKVLTIIATIFIPLGFIASLYGMNFDRTSPWNMPELGWRFGYPFSLLLMGGVLIGLIVYFRRQGWLGGANAKQQG